VVHLICQSDFDARSQQYYLMFEKKFGYLEKCNYYSLEKLIHKMQIQLVIVSSASNQAIGQFFR